MRPVFDQALLDTSVVIDYPARSVAVQTAAAAVSTITLAELAYGLHTSDPTYEDREHTGALDCP